MQNRKTPMALTGGPMSDAVISRDWSVRTTDEHALAAAMSLQSYAYLMAKESARPDEVAGVVSDLLADIMLLCARSNMDFAKIVADAGERHAALIEVG